MAPGRYNSQSKNYGGEHTGIGKKKHKGYYRSGERLQTIASKHYIQGTKVREIRTNNIGTVLDKSNEKIPRSMIKILFSNEIKYLYTKHITILQSNIVEKTSIQKQKSSKQKEKTEQFILSKKNELKNILELKHKSKQDRISFRKNKKLYNSLIKDGIYIDSDGNFKKLYTDNKVINSIIDTNFKKLLELEIKWNKQISILSVKLSKYQILRIFNLIDINTKDQYYENIHRFSNGFN